jgi:hypothetical protein
MLMFRDSGKSPIVGRYGHLQIDVKDVPAARASKAEDAIDVNAGSTGERLFSKRSDNDVRDL